MRTTPPCVLESVSVMPFTARLNMGRLAFQVTVVSSEELLSASEDELSSEDDDSVKLEELIFPPAELDELDSIPELLLDSTDELDSSLEELISELLDSSSIPGQ